jgi:hypothetical protein
MMLLAKAALGLSSAVVLAGAYTFREGVIRISVDEYRSGGSHIHLWVPAAAVPMAMHLVPREHMRGASREVREALPMVRAIAKELKKYPDADLIEIRDGEQHVQMRTNHGRLQIDVEAPGETVHVLCPLSTIEDLAEQLETYAPGA